MHDVGKILTTIATMSTEELANVSETIRPSGTEASTARNCGDNVDSKAKYLSFLLTGPEFKWKTLENGDQNPYPFMRFPDGGGSIDARAKSAGGLGTDNDLANPGQTRFKWKTMREFVS